ncbi:MAG: hypothetical protein KKF44_05400 [Nanoarchaeota archaeon]|nr:hypothetical protein [Nanoarchaeota archaeon]
MEYFVRPSKTELVRVEEELKTLNQFMQLLDERAKLLSNEKTRLKEIVSAKRDNVKKFKDQVIEKSDEVMRKYGLSGLKRVSHFSAPTMQIDLVEEMIAGVKYRFPKIMKVKEHTYPLSISSFEIDDLSDASGKLMENIIDLSKYIEAEKRLEKEIRQVRRKLFAVKNILLPEEERNKKMIKSFLSEKERSEKIIKMMVIEKIQG